MLCGSAVFFWIPCDRRGSTVRLQLLGNDTLNLQYVGVEGKDPKAKPSPRPAVTTIAMANARQSSEYSSSATPDVSFAADKCLTDSGAYESMCITRAESGRFWEATAADGAPHDISAVVVRNRADCIGTTRALAPFPLSSTCRAGCTIRVADERRTCPRADRQASARTVSKTTW